MAALATPDATLPPPRVRVCGNSFFFDLVLLLFFFETNMVAGGGEEEEGGRGASAANCQQRHPNQTDRQKGAGGCVCASWRAVLFDNPSVCPPRTDPAPAYAAARMGTSTRPSARAAHCCVAEIDFGGANK